MLTTCKYIDVYIALVRDGKIKANEDIHKACDLVERKLNNPDVFIDVDKIEKAVEIIERYLEMKLLPWELFIIALVHCYYQSNDSVVFDEFFIMMGRGNGKNGFISGLAFYLSTHFHGVKGYNIDIIANSEDQARTSFDDIYEVLGRFWTKLKNFFYKSKTEIKNLKTGSYIRYNTSNARTKDGKRSACLIFDEEHEYENSKTIGVFQSGFGKRKHSRIFKITTNGYVRDGVLDDDLRLAEDVLNGENEELGLLPLLYRMPDDESCMNPDLWEMANPSLLYFPELLKQMKKEFKKMKYDKQVELDFYTKRMNRPRSDNEIQVTEWENILATKREIPDLTGNSCICGVDYASINDFASVNLHFLIDGVRYDINHSWLCQNSADLNRIKAPWETWVEDGELTLVKEKKIDPALLAEWVWEKAKQYNILKIVLDNNRYALVKKAFRDIGFDEDTYKNVICVRPNDISKVEPVITDAFIEQSFVWGDNRVLRWGAWNTKKERRVVKTGVDNGMWGYVKIEGKSRKTDPFMALVHSMTQEDLLVTSQTVWCDVMPAVG